MSNQQLAFDFDAEPECVPLPAKKSPWSAANGNSPAFIDLFAGVGGFHYGLTEAGAICVAAAEINRSARRTYEHVHGRTSPDLFKDGAARFFRDVSQMAVAGNDNVPLFDIMAAGFPCQAFSVAGKKEGFDDEMGRGIMFFELVRLLYLYGPIAFIFENVRGLLGHDGGRTWRVIQKIVANLGYRMVHQVIRGTDYGIPQLRPRVFMVGVRRDALPATISDDAMRTALFPHLSREIPLSFTFDSVVGGKSGRSASKTILSSGFKKTVGGYANWSTYTVDVNGAKTIISLSVDQCIRLMGLPEDFSFPEGTAETNKRKQLGNGVIVPVVSELAKALIAFVEGNVSPEARLPLPREPSDDGHLRIINDVLVANGLSPLDRTKTQIQKEQKMKTVQESVAGRTRSNSFKPAANDNAAKPCGRIAAYGEPGKVTVHITVPMETLSRGGIGDGDKVKVEARTVTVSGKPCQVWRLFAAPDGRTMMERTKNTRLLQARGLATSPFSAVGLVEHKVGSGKRPFIELRLATPGNNAGSDAQSPEKLLGEKFLLSFATLTCGAAGANRLKFLAANNNNARKKQTTAAGDECYTPRFLVDAVLRAAEREEFDADFCSMRADGRYDLALPAEVLESGLHKGLQVIGHVPAKRYYTRKNSQYGSLLVRWAVELGWFNPPYSNRTWAVFLEKAAKEVAEGRAGTLVGLVPKDDTGEHIGQLFSENAYRIELCHQLPFFKKEIKKKKKEVRKNVIETIRGNQLVVFGKGGKTRRFLERLVDELHTLGFITANQLRHYREQYALAPRLKDDEPKDPPVPPAPSGPPPRSPQSGTVGGGGGKPPKPRKRKAASAGKPKTGIAWATETVNPFKGCSNVSPECKHCYAVGWAARHQAQGSRGYAGTVKNMTFTGKIGVVPEVIDELRSAKSDRVFVNSMSDTFHANVSDADVRAVFDAMTANPSKSQFLVCTKRADRMAAFSQAYAVPDKVWCGVTVGCRKSLHRLDDLRRVKAKIRWVSVEPLLEEIDIEPWLADGTVNWVVVGGESGPNHRPMDKAWVEKIARACQKHNVPFFFKQWSARIPKKDAEYPPTIDGRVWQEYPVMPK